MTPVRTAARAMLGTLFVISGAQTVRHPDRLVPAAQPFADRLAPTVQRINDRIPTDARSLVRFNGAVHVVGGLLMVTRWYRPAALALAASMVPTTAVGHPFWKAENPAAARTERIQFGKNMSILGGLLLAAADGNGRPSVGWRLRHRRTGPGPFWRARQALLGQPGLVPRAAQLATGRPGIAPRAAQATTGRAGIVGRTRHTGDIARTRMALKAAELRHSLSR